MSKLNNIKIVDQTSIDTHFKSENAPISYQGRDYQLYTCKKGNHLSSRITSFFKAFTGTFFTLFLGLLFKDIRRHWIRAFSSTYTVKRYVILDPSSPEKRVDDIQKNIVGNQSANSQPPIQSKNGADKAHDVLKKENVQNEVSTQSITSISLAKTKEDEAFPLDEVKNDCQLWMNAFLKDFEPSKVKKYKFEQLYLEDVVSSNEEIEVMQGIFNALWSNGGKYWEGQLPDGWNKHSESHRALNVENPKYPGYIFKFCKSPPGRGVPAAHFLRVPQGREIQRIVNKEILDELEIVDERLIALKSQDEIQNENEYEQCYHFVVKSKKINLLDKTETIARLCSLSQQKQIQIATQIMRMICSSGLGDVGFHNFKINKETGKLVVLDTEPLFGSLLLDEESKIDWQYTRNNELITLYPNSRTVTDGLNNMIEACNQLPVFEKVATIYKEYFPVYSE